jgi:type II secretory pathway pseudopilin PulG
MNKEKQIPAIVVMSFLLAIAALSISGLTNLEALGQQQNATNATAAISNQTGQQNATNATAAISNQTGATAENQTSTMAGLSQDDFNTLKDNLNAAREAVQDNDPAGAVGDLGSARTELNILMTQVGGEDSPGGQQLMAVRNHIDAAEDAAGNADTLTAFQGINAADTELLKITQIIPADEE